jgi:hypothetical protein
VSIPSDYTERVYAGVLGKIIGVYLGRPFEGWTYERIMDGLGEIAYYVHEKLDKPLIVTDDDIAGTFTFLRALSDYGHSRDLTPAQIGQTWLNYIIEGRTILWWGGLGNSTEHTAYLHLKSGIKAPHSGSMTLNGKVLAETDFAWEFGGTYEFSLQVAGRHLEASINGQVLFSVDDTHRPLTGGGVALVCEEGCISSDAVTVQSDNTGAQMEGVKR